MHPFWNKVVLVCPKWVAPNLLTFLGFIFTLATFCLFIIYDFDLYASSRDHPSVKPIPNYVFLIASFLIFIAYTLDGLDGKQASRTQTSTPLGELFDHGVDSWSTVFIPTALYSVFGRGEHSIPSIRFHFVVWNVSFNFYLSHWEKYNTGVLFLPWGYDISMCITTALFATTGFFGYEIWKFNLWYNINAGHLVELFFYLSALVVNIPVILSNIYKSYKHETGKMHPFGEAVRPLIPVFVCFAIGAVWVVKSPTNIVDRYPRAFYVMSGTIFSNICCRLIVSQMSNTRCDIFNWLLVPLSLSTFLSLSLPTTANTSETSILLSMLALVTLTHLHYSCCVVRQMCRHFRIYCFQIKKRDE